MLKSMYRKRWRRTFGLAAVVIIAIGVVVWLYMGAPLVRVSYRQQVTLVRNDNRLYDLMSEKAPVDQMRALIAEDPSVLNYRSPEGHTLLHEAVERQRADVVHLLLLRGVEVDPKIDMASGAWNAGETPLLIAIQFGDIEIVKQLLAAGADIDATSKDGYEALELAERKGHDAIADLIRKSRESPEGDD